MKKGEGKSISEIKKEYVGLKADILKLINDFKFANGDILQMPTEIRMYLSEQDTWKEYHMYFKLEIK